MITRQQQLFEKLRELASEGGKTAAHLVSSLLIKINTSQSLQASSKDDETFKRQIEDIHALQGKISTAIPVIRSYLNFKMGRSIIEDKLTIGQLSEQENKELDSHTSYLDIPMVVRLNELLKEDWETGKKDDSLFFEKIAQLLLLLLRPNNFTILDRFITLEIEIIINQLKSEAAILTETNIEKIVDKIENALLRSAKLHREEYKQRYEFVYSKQLLAFILRQLAIATEIIDHFEANNLLRMINLEFMIMNEKQIHFFASIINSLAQAGLLTQRNLNKMERHIRFLPELAEQLEKVELNKLNQKELDNILNQPLSLYHTCLLFFKKNPAINIASLPEELKVKLSNM